MMPTLILLDDFAPVGIGVAEVGDVDDDGW
jgi:hypothetical protein